MSIVDPRVPEPTPAEFAVLQVLWRAGPATVGAVHDKLYGDRDVSYTTTLRLLQNLHSKGLLARTRSGRQHVYRPLIAEAPALSALVERLAARAFSGSRAALALNALGAAKPTLEEIASLRALLDALSDDA